MSFSIYFSSPGCLSVLNYYVINSLPHDLLGFAGGLFFDITGLSGIWPQKYEKCRICLVDKFGIHHGNGERIRSRLRARSVAGLAIRRKAIQYRDGSNPCMRKNTKHPTGASYFWQRRKDSNPHKRSQSPVCYLYTTPLKQ